MDSKYPVIVCSKSVCRPGIMHPLQFGIDWFIRTRSQTLVGRCQLLPDLRYVQPVAAFVTTGLQRVYLVAVYQQPVKCCRACHPYWRKQQGGDQASANCLPKAL